MLCISSFLKNQMTARDIEANDTECKQHFSFAVDNFYVYRKQA